MDALRLFRAPCAFIAFIAVVGFAFSARAQPRQGGASATRPSPANAVHARPNSPARAAAAAGPSGIQKPFEVRGQTRKLDMMLMTRGDTGEIEVIKPRKDFRPEMRRTQD